MLQESFVAVWEKAAGYDPARGSAMLADYDRAPLRGDRSAAPPRRPPESRKAAGGGTGLTSASRDLADRRAELRELQRCLDELDEAPRRAVLLAYCYGLTRDELARAARGAGRTVKSWLRRSLERLKRCLEA